LICLITYGHSYGWAAYLANVARWGPVCQMNRLHHRFLYYTPGVVVPGFISVTVLLRKESDEGGEGDRGGLGFLPGCRCVEVTLFGYCNFLSDASSRREDGQAPPVYGSYMLASASVLVSPPQLL
jgi:hypothetical protein